MTAKEAHAGFLQTLRDSPAVNVRLKGGLNKSAAPLNLPSLRYCGPQLPGQSMDVTDAFRATFMYGASWADPVTALQAKPRQRDAHLHYRLLLSALEPSLGGYWRKKSNSRKNRGFLQEPWLCPV